MAIKIIHFTSNTKISTIIGFFTGCSFALYDSTSVILKSRGDGSQFFRLIWPAVLIDVMLGILGMILLGSLMYTLLRLGEYRFDKYKLISLQVSIAMLLSSSLILTYILGPAVEIIGYTFFLSLFVAIGTGTLIYLLTSRYPAKKLVFWGVVTLLLLYSAWPLWSIMNIRPLKHKNTPLIDFRLEKINNSDDDKRPNILWIVMDTARADHLSSYGYARNTTPQIDRIAKEGVLYKNAITAAPWTLPSHASMFTGLFPSEHGVDSDWTWLGENFDTIAEILKKYGYYTAGFSNNAFVSQKQNLSQGFDTFLYFERDPGFESESLLLSRSILKLQNIFDQPEVLTRLYNFINAPLSRLRGTAENTNNSVKTHIDKARKNKTPFFIFINYMEVHDPYGDTPWAGKYLKEIGMSELSAKGRGKTIESNILGYIAGKKDLTEQDTKIINALYDGDLAFLDMQIGKLVKYLRDEKLLDDTVLIITSDHGENLGEHNLIAHVYDIHKTLTNVPLVIRYPKLFSPHSTEERIVQTVDIFPTILDITGIEFDKKKLSGFSLFDKNRPQIAVSETTFKGGFIDISDTIKMLKDPTVDQRNFGGEWKSIQTDISEYIVRNSSKEFLYNIKGDPDELRNIIDSDSQKLKEMRRVLNQSLKKLDNYWTIPDLFEHE